MNERGRWNIDGRGWETGKYRGSNGISVGRGQLAEADQPRRPMKVCRGYVPGTIQAFSHRSLTPLKRRSGLGGLRKRVP